MELADLKGRHKVLLYLTGIIIPCICFILALLAAPIWQNDRPGAYALVFLGAAGSCPFWPLLIFSMVAMHRLLFLKDAHQKGTVRLGLAGGILLSVQYCIALAATVTNSWPLAVLLAAGVELGLIAILFVLNFLWRKIRARFPQITLGNLFFALTLLAIVGWSLYTITQIYAPNRMYVGLWTIPKMCLPYLFVFLCLGPAYCLTAYLYAYFFLLKPGDAEPKEIVRKRRGIWAAVYLGSWTASIPLLLWRYSFVPTSPPSCYVATAAAKGHTALTGSAIVNCGGQPVLINQQMRILKCFECLMQIVTPRFHYYFRSLYDTVGPVLAKQIKNPLAADIVYLLLKPFEYTAKLILCAVVPNTQKSIAQFYRYTAEKLDMS